MAGVGPPPGPYLGFQSSVQPIGFERFQLDNPAADDNRPAGSPLPPSQDTYQPTCNLNANYDIAVSLPATSTTHPYHQYEGEISENGVKLPYVGFEWIAKEDEDTKVTRRLVFIYASYWVEWQILRCLIQQHVVQHCALPMQNVTWFCTDCFDAELVMLLFLSCH